MTDNYLLSLWRQAVLTIYHHRCAFCNVHGDDLLQCHHVVRRYHKITRYLPINGIPLCHECHKMAHTKRGEQRIQMLLGEKYDALVEMEQVSYKQYLLVNGITDREYMENTAAVLKTYEG